MVLVKNDQYWLPYALESTRNLFNNYVIYDINSLDNTKEVICDFINSLPSDVTVSLRLLPECSPDIQGCFRNSMIAESLTDWYFILDGDEVYSHESVLAIKRDFESMVKAHSTNPKKIYGVLKRVEVGENLQYRYDETKSHHRIYHRTAIWKGTHPGEIPVVKQCENTEFYFNDDAICYHFHNANRSPFEAFALKRLKRKAQQTYHPGKLVPFNIFKTLPILMTPVGQQDISPDLKELQVDKM